MSNSEISSDVIGGEDEKGGQAEDRSTKKVRYKDQRVESNSMTTVDLVSPWSTDFDPAKPYPSMVKTWIRLSGFPDHLYNRKILWEIEELVGKAVRSDFNIDYKARGRFDRMEGQPVVIERGEPDVAMESTNKEVESGLDLLDPVSIYWLMEIREGMILWGLGKSVKGSRSEF
ncbi:hypothetical protein GOBAR_DD28397 [Gossypium barbadense]|nr:hypothetical protein GOBAR_DD28397 [Gossypium barbadense]